MSVDVGTPIVPRLLNMHQAAAYLGCSYWSVRDYVLQGLIPPVDLPPLAAREGEHQRKRLRRVLLDRSDLDRFVDALKTGARSTPISLMKSDVNRGESDTKARRIDAADRRHIAGTAAR